MKRTWISGLRLHQDVIRSIVPQVVDASFHAGSNAIRDPEAFCRYTLQVGTLLMKDHPEFVGPYRDLGAAVLAGAKDKKREELDMIPLGREVVRTAEALKAAGALAGAALPK